MRSSAMSEPEARGAASAARRPRAVSASEHPDQDLLALLEVAGHLGEGAVAQPDLDRDLLGLAVRALHPHAAAVGPRPGLPRAARSGWPAASRARPRRLIGLEPRRPEAERGVRHLE